MQSAKMIASQRTKQSRRRQPQQRTQCKVWRDWMLQGLSPSDLKTFTLFHCIARRQGVKMRNKNARRLYLSSLRSEFVHGMSWSMQFPVYIPPCIFLLLALARETE